MILTQEIPPKINGGLTESSLIDQLYGKIFKPLQGFQLFPMDFDQDRPNIVENVTVLIRRNIRDCGSPTSEKLDDWFSRLGELTSKFGMQQGMATNHLRSLFKMGAFADTPSDDFEIRDSLISSFTEGYNKYPEQFNSMHDSHNEWETPLFKDSIFDKLPPTLKDITALFPERRERDIIHLSTMTLFSACFPKVKGIYDGRLFSMNIFSFISAPAASGKGVVDRIVKAAEGIHEEFYTDYQQQIHAYNNLSEDEKKDAVKPEMKKFLIPANTTSAKLIHSLSINQEFGLVIDTEADTLSTANRSEHGNFTEMLRKAFQHETIERERKTDNEYTRIKSPALSIIVSGTPNQVNNLVHDVENGLNSRFIHYSYIPNNQWKDVFEEKRDLTAIFKSISIELANTARPYLQSYQPGVDDYIMYSLSKEQEIKFNIICKTIVDNLQHIYGHDIRGAAFRLGLIFFRLTMILSVIRATGYGALTEKVYCTDDDFDVAASMIDTLSYHTAQIFTQLQIKKRVKGAKQLKELYLEKLPTEFNREQAMQIAGLMAINPKTAENYLSKAVAESILIKIKHNHYKKA